MCQAAAELGPLVVSLQELSQLERELQQAEWRQAVKVGVATDGECMLTEVAQDQVWLDPDVEQTENRYPELSKKGEHGNYANITLN